MAEFIKETINTQNDSANTVVATPVGVVTTPTRVVNTSTGSEATSSQTAEYLIYFLFGTLDVLLVFRLVLKLMGASTYSAFVGLVYGITGFFTLPFQGIFRSGYTQGVETTSVLEPATIVAIIVYAFLALGIVKLIRIFSGEKQKTD